MRRMKGDKVVAWGQDMLGAFNRICKHGITHDQAVRQLRLHTMDGKLAQGHMEDYEDELGLTARKVRRSLPMQGRGRGEHKTKQHATQAAGLDVRSYDKQKDGRQVQILKRKRPLSLGQRTDQGPSKKTCSAGQDTSGRQQQPRHDHNIPPLSDQATLKHSSRSNVNDASGRTRPAIPSATPASAASKAYCDDPPVETRTPKPPTTQEVSQPDRATRDTTSDTADLDKMNEALSVIQRLMATASERDEANERTLDAANARLDVATAQRMALRVQRDKAQRRLANARRKTDDFEKEKRSGDVGDLEDLEDQLPGQLKTIARLEEGVKAAEALLESVQENFGHAQRAVLKCRNARNSIGPLLKGWEAMNTKIRERLRARQAR